MAGLRYTIEQRLQTGRNADCFDLAINLVVLTCRTVQNDQLRRWMGNRRNGE